MFLSSQIGSQGQEKSVQTDLAKTNSSFLLSIFFSFFISGTQSSFHLPYKHLGPTIS